MFPRSCSSFSSDSLIASLVRRPREPLGLLARRLDDGRLDDDARLDDARLDDAGLGGARLLLRLLLRLLESLLPPDFLPPLDVFLLRRDVSPPLDDVPSDISFCSSV